MPSEFDDLDFSNASVDVEHPLNNSNNNWFPSKEQLLDFAASPHGFIRSGGDQVVQGLKDLWNKPTADEKLGAAGDMIRGIGTTMAPLGIAAGVGAPLEAAAGLAAGSAMDPISQFITDKLGGGKGLQNLTGAVAGGAAGAAAYSKAPSAGDLWNGLTNLNKADPQVGLARALSPRFSESGFGDRVPDTMAHIKVANGNKSPETIQEHGAAIDKAIATQQAAFKKNFMDPATAAGKTISGDNIVAATHQAVPFLKQVEDPQGVVDMLDDVHNTYAGRHFSVENWERILKGKNAELSSFYDKKTGNQIADQVAGKPLAIVKAQRDAAARALYHTLDETGQGYGPATIKKTIADMIDIKDANERATFKGIKQRPMTTAEKYEVPIKEGFRILKGGAPNTVPTPGSSQIESTLKKSYDAISHKPSIPTAGAQAPPAGPAGFNNSYWPNPNTPNYKSLAPPAQPSIQPNQPATTGEGQSKVTIEQIMKLLGPGGQKLLGGGQ